MRKTLLPIILTGILAASCVSNKPSSRITILPSYSKCPKSLPYLTCAHLTLKAEKYLGADNSDIKKLDAFLQNVSEKIPSLKKEEFNEYEAEEILKTIHKEVSQVFTNYQNGDLLYEAFRTGKADCERFSMLYMAVAEKEGLPLKAVFARGGRRMVSGMETNIGSHVFVRWHFKKPMPYWLNWETTKGEVNSDDIYDFSFNGLREINDFRRWCIDTRFSYCKEQFGTNFNRAKSEAYKMLGR